MEHALVKDLQLRVELTEYHVSAGHATRAVRLAYGYGDAALYVTWRDDFYVGAGIANLLPGHLKLLNELLPPSMHLADLDTYYALLVSAAPTKDHPEGTRTEYALTQRVNLWDCSDEVHTWKRRTIGKPQPPC